MRATTLVKIVAGLFLATGLARADGVDTQTVEYLLDYVADSGLVFIRNGKQHDSVAAADHMRGKYEHFSKKIATPEDFIERAATKSLMSGKAYLVVLETGETVPTAIWLNAALENYLSRQTAHNPGIVAE